MVHRHRLLLIRHAQASFLAEEYDQLSELGRRQAQALADYLLDQQWHPQAVFCGDLRRHQQTVEILRKGFDRSGIPFPEPEISPAWNESDAWAVFEYALPELAARDALFAQAWRMIRQETRSDSRILGRAYRMVTRMWARGELTGLDHGLESWTAFRNRVETGLRPVLEALQQHPLVLVVTSGGPIAATVGHALDLQDERIIELSWHIYNASVHEFRLLDGRFVLKAFNTTPHLTRAEWLTYV